MDKTEFHLRLGQFLDELVQGLERAADLAVKLNVPLALQACYGGAKKTVPLRIGAGEVRKNWTNSC